MSQFRVITILCAIFLSLSSYGGNREKAYRLHIRITGVPPSQAMLNQYEVMIATGKEVDAARMMMNDSSFYNITLKNWVKKWSNQEQTNRVDLNDYTATVIGAVRDNLPFNSILYSDILYIGENTSEDIEPYSNENNKHYEELESKNVDLKTALVRRTQSTVSGISQTSGVLTTRASAEAFFSAGTNRRVNRFLFMNYLCKDYEALHDITVPDIFVRRDVDRSPGGDSRTYKNKCVGCHAGQDSFANAWAYYDYDGKKLVYSPGQVVGKVNLNNLFPARAAVNNDSWTNLWAYGQNSSLGWRGSQSGTGGRSFAYNVATTKAFANCMAEKSFEWLCLIKNPNSEQKEEIAQLANEFESIDNYNLKELLAKTSSLCLGE